MTVTMILHRTTSGLVGYGQFGDVFRSDESTVVKVFCREPNAPIPDVVAPADYPPIARGMWDAECRAYEYARDHPPLGRHLPGYHGRVSVEDIRGERGESVAGRYLLSCGYRVDLVPGNAVSMGFIIDEGYPQFGTIDAYLDELNDVGIRHPYDCSIFLHPGERGDFTVIDIAMEDVLGNAVEQLSTNGRLSAAFRAKWTGT